MWYFFFDARSAEISRVENIGSISKLRPYAKQSTQFLCYCTMAAHSLDPPIVRWNGNDLFWVFTLRTLDEPGLAGSEAAC